MRADYTMKRFTNWDLFMDYINDLEEALGEGIQTDNVLFSTEDFSRLFNLAFQLAEKFIDTDFKYGGVYYEIDKEPIWNTFKAVVDDRNVNTLAKLKDKLNAMVEDLHRALIENHPSFESDLDAFRQQLHVDCTIKTGMLCVPTIITMATYMVSDELKGLLEHLDFTRLERQSRQYDEKAVLTLKTLLKEKNIWSNPADPHKPSKPDSHFPSY